MKEILEQRRENFEEFLVEIPMMLEDLQDLLKNSNNYSSITVDYDYVTIYKIENFYIDILTKKEKIDISNDRLDRILIAYIGEAIMERAKMGKWELDDDKRSSNFGMIHIIYYSNIDHLPVYPLTLLDWIKKELKPTLAKDIELFANLEQDAKDFFKEFE